jgi:hypothetical protein
VSVHGKDGAQGGCRRERRKRAQKELNMSKVVTKFVASLAALGLAATLSLSSVAAAEMVPYKAKAAGSFSFVNVNGGPGLHLVGAGNVSFLGAATSDGTIAFLGMPDSATGCIPIHDDQTLTSVDTGEQITIEVNGKACPTTGASQPFATGVYQIIAPFTITGGTGRFAQASGGGDAVCLGDFDHGTFSFTQQGTVSRPGGAK